MEHMTVLLLTVLIALGMAKSVATGPSDSSVPASHMFSTEREPAPPQLTDLETGTQMLRTPILLHPLSNLSLISHPAPSNENDRSGDVVLHSNRSAFVEMGSRFFSNFLRGVPFVSIFLSLGVFIFSVFNFYESCSYRHVCTPVPTTPYWSRFVLAQISWLLALVGIPALIDADVTGAIPAVAVGFYCRLTDIWLSGAVTLSERPLSALRIGLQSADFLLFFSVFLAFFISAYRRYSSGH